MPAQVKKVDNMQKNLTEAQKAARKKAEELLNRQTVKLKCPAYVTDSPAAKKYWKSFTKDIVGMELFDNLDSDALGGYCMMLVRRDDLSCQYSKLTEEIREQADLLKKAKLLDGLNGIVSRLQAQERNILQYAEKLGLTPSGRARLAYKKAEAEQLDPDEAAMFGR